MRYLTCNTLVSQIGVLIIDSFKDVLKMSSEIAPSVIPEKLMTALALAIIPRLGTPQGIGGIIENIIPIRQIYLT